MRVGDLVEYVNGEVGIVTGVGSFYGSGSHMVIDVLFGCDEFEVDPCGLKTLASIVKNEDLDK